MVELIARYLSFEKQVSIKGIGTFSAEHLPARLDFPNRLLHAPEQILHFSSTNNLPDEAFNEWLQGELKLTAEEVKIREQNLLADFQRTLSDAGKVRWEGIGTFSKDEQQVLHFVSGFETVKLPPVTAEKIIRKNTQHSIRVGEEEKTNIEMEELLSGQQRKPLNLWWLIALALLLSALVAILYFATNYSQQWGKQGNEQKLKTKDMPPLYKIQ